MHLTRTLVCTLLTALPLAAPVAHAQSVAAAATAKSAAPAPSRREQQAIEWFNMLDANKDGRISRQEAEPVFKYKPALAEEFQRLDANNDGYLTQPELRAEADRRRAERLTRRQREAAVATAAPATPAKVARTRAQASSTR